jgi:hypothetical protein
VPLHLYPNVHASGSVPAGWIPAKGGALKYPVRNAKVLEHLRQLLKGKWQKVIKDGNSGEIHYFEHSSGQVAGVKFFPRTPKS